LNGPGSAKDTRHIEISLEGANLSYEVGDALGVMPSNCPELVADLIRALKCDEEAAVPGAHGQETSLRNALLNDYEITRIPHAFLQAVAEKSGDAALQRLAAPGVNGELKEFSRGREIIDLLLAFPRATFSAAEFISLLKKLQPRLYSISSSPKVHPGEVHLTVSAVRYESHGRRRKGVCSTFLADRLRSEGMAPVFVQPNKNFRLPADATKPLVMVGPGTGIAPFRAFLEERKAAGAPGKTWLLFGDQHERTDLLYSEELQTMLREGTLTKLTTAFSRDQPQKIYVQDRMLEEARQFYAWFEEGASFYVCGDAARMAKDVHQALHQVIERAGGQSSAQAADYVKRLQSEKRYQRDVY
jgi:sulfite reductase (NADPH) flavoprotein alpha-component